MKLLNHIHDVIRRYPTLYKTDTYENAELLVLDQLFLTNGNGYEWYDGYLTDVCDDPAPYGEVEPDLLPAGFFDHIEWKLERVEPSMVKFFEEMDIDCGFVKKGGEWYQEREQVSKNVLTGKFSRFSPYPICQYAKMETIPDDVRPDWLAGCIKVVKATLKYYQDDERVKDNFYYPTEGRIRSTTADWTKWWADKEKHTGSIKVFGITEEVMADIPGKMWNSWYKHRAGQIKYATDFLGEHQ